MMGLLATTVKELGGKAFKRYPKVAVAISIIL